MSPTYLKCQSKLYHKRSMRWMYVTIIMSAIIGISGQTTYENYLIARAAFVLVLVPFALGIIYRCKQLSCASRLQSTKMVKRKH